MKIMLVLLTTGFLFVAPMEKPLKRPYECGPVLKKKSIKTFDRLNDYLGLKPGSVFAEIGTSSGYYNAAMAVYLDSVTFYLQDIDEACLNQKNLDKVLKYYSKFKDDPVNATNTFHIVIGEELKTNLPENTMDVVFSNGTFHVFSHPDSIMADAYRALKTGGIIAVRDKFVFDGIEEICEDETCANPLTHYEDFLAIMERTGFSFVEKDDSFGYPVVKFEKK